MCTGHVNTGVDDCTRSVYVERMNTVPDIIDKFGGNTAFAAVLGARHSSTASEMKRRNSIPVRHWPAIIAAAAERGIPLSYDDLVRIHTVGPDRPDHARAVLPAPA